MNKKQLAQFKASNRQLRESESIAPLDQLLGYVALRVEGLSMQAAQHFSQQEFPNEYAD